MLSPVGKCFVIVVFAVGGPIACDQSTSGNLVTQGETFDISVANFTSFIISTCDSSFDTRVVVYNGDSVTEVCSNESLSCNAEEVSFSCHVAPGEYEILLTSSSGTGTGDYNLSVGCAEPPG